MLRKILWAFITALFFFFSIRATRAQEVSPSAEIPIAEPRVGKLADCFDYYHFPGVTFDLRPKYQNNKELLAGETLYLVGTIENISPVAISEGEVYYRLVKKNPDPKKRRGEGDMILDEGVLFKNINLMVKEKKEVSANYTLPKSLSFGEHALNLYFIVDKKYNWAGLLFTDDVIGGFVPLNVLGGEKSLPYFDRSQTKINGEPYTHIGWLRPYEVGSELKIETTLTNPASEKFSVLVKSEFMSWDGLQESPLEVENQQIELEGGKSQVITFKTPPLNLPVYFLRQTATFEDTQTRSKSKNILNVRLGTQATSARFNALGLSNFPLKSGESNKFYVCFHANAMSPFEGKLEVGAKTESGKTFARAVYEGLIGPNIMGITSDFKVNEESRKVILEGKLTDTEGKTVDTAEVVYNCEDFENSLCPEKLVAVEEAKRITRPLVGFLILPLIILLLLYRLWRKRKSRSLKLFILGPFILFSLSLFMAGTVNAAVDVVQTFLAGKWRYPWDYVKIESDIFYTVEATPTVLRVGEELKISIIDRSGTFIFQGGFMDSPYIYFPNDDSSGWDSDPFNLDPNGSYFAGFFLKEPEIAGVISFDSSVLDCPDLESPPQAEKKCTALKEGRALISVLMDLKNAYFFGYTPGFPRVPGFNPVYLGSLTEMPTASGDFIIQVVKNNLPRAECGNVSDITETTATLNWGFSDPDGDTQGAWQIQGSTRADFSVLDFNLEEDNDQTSTTVTNLSDNTTYYWRVRVMDSYNEWSSWASCSSFTTKKIDNPPTCNIWPTEGVIYTNAMTTINGEASDPDEGQTPVWSGWTATGGTFDAVTGSPPRIWTAPRAPDKYTLTATVNSGNLSASCPTEVLVEQGAPSCTAIAADPPALFLGKTAYLTADVSGPQLSYAWQVTPNVGTFDNPEAPYTLYTAPLTLPPSGSVTLNLTLENFSGQASCPALTLPIYEGVIQGRIFNDLNENGIFDEGESLLTSSIGNLSLSPPGTLGGLPQDGCEISEGYRFGNIPPEVNHTLSFTTTAADWYVTGAYYTQGGPNCDSALSSLGGQKISPTQYQVDNVNVWSESPTVNLWLGAKYSPPPCDPQPPGNLGPVDACQDYSSFDLRWDSPLAPQPPTSYTLQIDEDASFASPMTETLSGNPLPTSYRVDPVVLTWIDRGETLYFRVKASYSCGESNWSESKLMIKPGIDRLTMQHLPSGTSESAPGDDRVEVWLEFESLNGGEINFDYAINGTSVGAAAPKSFLGGLGLQTETETFTGFSLTGGESVLASVELVASDPVSSLSCGVTNSVGSSVLQPSWLQVVDGDVYANCDATFNPNCSVDGSVHFFVYYAPPAPYNPYFLDASAAAKGGVILAREGISCDNCAPPPAGFISMINRRELNITNYNYNPEWLWPEVIGRLTNDLPSTPQNPVEVIVESGDITLTPSNLSPGQIYEKLGREDDLVVLLVDGNVTIDRAVDNLYGVIIVKGGNHELKVEGTGNDPRLRVKGALYSEGGFDFEDRGLSDNRSPAILLEYDPRYVVNPRPELQVGQYTWLSY